MGLCLGRRGPREGWGKRVGPGCLPRPLTLVGLPDSGIVTGLYTTSSPEACQYIARDSRANVIVVDTQKQLEKILKVWGQNGLGSDLGSPRGYSPPAVPSPLARVSPHSPLHSAQHTQPARWAALPPHLTSQKIQEVSDSLELGFLVSTSYPHHGFSIRTGGLP